LFVVLMLDDFKNQSAEILGFCSSGFNVI